ncbi:dynein axonemal assembly factor 11-like isoform X2 [Xenia sp. Carnegie-2017]|uniref:dynein axonemal assembly factor 11-like isoform X2 n=1 Tax=Xenia sp. Carnegie-2017 TaxID=2897299 RepID=UPI001F04362A|nr:dynein axonemal assembly factor 11-like isoform X2 [Xenia sp. Carnegie-2017]
MVRISEDLVRKRAEHNNCELSTLEEVSLHQLDIERLEFLDKICRELKILYLQSNLISKIENVGRLKKLEYLNLALNNIEIIENLEGCESLQKLDLTVNFVGKLTSVKCLQANYHLREVYLTGNPCAQFNGYRQYVIVTLPQLKTLDGREIEKSERILAKQVYENITQDVIDQENKYQEKTEQKRKFDKENKENEKLRNEATQNVGAENNEKDDQSFWQEEVEYTPESRIEIHKHLEEQRKRREQTDKRGENTPKEIKYFASDGRPLNMNRGKLDFEFTEDEENNVFIFDLSCPKYLDTSLINVDLQTTYLRVNVKGKIMQLALPEEIMPDSSTAKRSQTTGHLVLSMPKLNAVVRPKSMKQSLVRPMPNQKKMSSSSSNKLEVDPSVRKDMDFSNIVKETRKEVFTSYTSSKTQNEDFVDNADVPPLI